MIDYKIQNNSENYTLNYFSESNVIKKNAQKKQGGFRKIEIYKKFIPDIR